jgi:hypothetical protein
VRDTVDLAKIKRRHRTASRRGKPATTLKSTTADRALARYAESPQLQIVNALLHALMDRANTALPKAFRTVPVNLFGKANNRLDPLDFNGQATARESGEVCLPRGCVKIIVEICSPKICAGGGASAGLTRLDGLSSVHFTSLDVRSTMGPSDGILKVSAQLGISFGSLGAAGFAEAHGGVAGINIPASASASANIANVTATSKVLFTVDLRQPKLTSIQLNDFTLRRGAVSIHISGLGAFNFLVSPLLNQLESFVKLFFNVDGAISNAVRGALQSQLNALLS